MPPDGEGLKEMGDCLSKPSGSGLSTGLRIGDCCREANPHLPKSELTSVG